MKNAQLELVQFRLDMLCLHSSNKMSTLMAAANRRLYRLRKVVNIHKNNQTKHYETWQLIKLYKTDINKTMQMFIISSSGI